MTDPTGPTPQAVALWLRSAAHSGLDRTGLHDQGWKEVNRRFHSIARAARPYILAQFKTPKEQAAAFDGLTLALLTIGHFEDIAELSKLYKNSKTPTAINTDKPASIP